MTRPAHECFNNNVKKIIMNLFYDGVMFSRSKILVIHFNISYKRVAHDIKSAEKKLILFSLFFKCKIINLIRYTRFQR